MHSLWDIVRVGESILFRISTTSEDDKWDTKMGVMCSVLLLRLALKGLKITWHASYGGVEHEGLLAPVGGACGVGRCTEQDVVVGGILLTATELDVKEAAEALHRTVLKHVHAEICLLHSTVRVLTLGAPEPNL